jgi:hypothetical protein
MAQIKPKGKQLDILSVAADIAADTTAIGSIATGVTSDPGATATLDLNYVRRDGSGVMIADLDLGTFDILNVVNVAGRNIVTDGTNQDNHIADPVPHRVINDIGTSVTDLWSAMKIGGGLNLKADKVLVSVVGNFAGLDAGGNITDSGSNASTFATLVHTHVAADITDFASVASLSAPIQLVAGKTGVVTLVEADITDLGTYEVAFVKNTAFNKNFGNATTTVCEGDDTRLSDARTPTAHTHVEADITDLQSYLLDITGQAITALSDVFTTMVPVDGQVLTFDSTNGWQSEVLPPAPVTSVAGKTGVVTLVEADITDLGTYEVAFVKNTAFNKDFGTVAATVCEGDDTRLSDARTPIAHTHVEADITDLGTTVATVATPTFTGTVGFPTYTIGTLPAQATGHQIYVSDATGLTLTGSMCFSNGTVWIDVTTGVLVV